MPSPALSKLDRELVRLHDLVDALVEPWAAAAAASVTAGTERAVLRLLGVQGVDHDGRPLAGEVVDRYLSDGAGRLAGGILLPFVVAMMEYDLDPQALALDVASRAVDLGLEADLLRRPGRREAAEVEVRRLVAAGLDRIDDNRTARLELIDVLGEPVRPWVGTTLQEPVVHEAVSEAIAAVRGGADVLRVEVPSGRELTVRLGAVGVEVERWQPHPDRPATELGADLAPAGSQRGLARLRGAADAAAAERSAYVRLVAGAQALSAPEAAVVAASERIDLVESNPMEEIVATGVDPDRALADHAFARRLHRRAGASILLSGGPLVVGPDLASGVPSNPDVRAGRGLALQLLSAGLAVADGLAPDHVVVGALPAWLLDEREPFAMAAAEILLRRMLLPRHPLAFIEPADSLRVAAWPFLLGALMPASPTTALVLRLPSVGPFAPIAEASRAAAAVAAELSGALDAGRLQGRSLEHAVGVLASAAEMLERLGSHGWGAILGDGLGSGTGTSMDRAGWLGSGHDSVTRRTEPFDPIAEALAAPSD